jgi:hypothetical protein
MKQSDKEDLQWFLAYLGLFLFGTIFGILWLECII